MLSISSNLSFMESSVSERAMHRIYKCKHWPPFLNYALRYKGVEITQANQVLAGILSASATELTD